MVDWYRTTRLRLGELSILKDLLQYMLQERSLVALQSDLTQALENASDSQVVVERIVQVCISIPIVISSRNLSS